MPKDQNFARATDGERALMDGIIALYHTRLTDVGVTIGLVFAEPDPEKEGSVLSHGGYTAAALAVKTTASERRHGAPDCEIQIDRWTWERIGEASRAALIDHELTHFVPKKDKDDVQILDKRLRPVIELRRHDFQIGGFDEVVSRHGDAALGIRSRNHHSLERGRWPAHPILQRLQTAILHRDHGRHG